MLTASCILTKHKPSKKIHFVNYASVFLLLGESPMHITYHFHSIRRRRQNFILLQECLKERKQEQEEKDKNELERIQRKFRKARSHYVDNRISISNSFGRFLYLISVAIICDTVYYDWTDTLNNLFLQYLQLKKCPEL